MATEGTYVITSGYSNTMGIYQLTDDGSIVLIEDIVTATNISFFALDPDDSTNLYAIHEVDNYDGQPNKGGVSHWKLKLSGVDSSVTFGNGKTSGGSAPAHIALDKSNSMIHVANYGSGSYAVFKLNADGSVGDEIYQENYPKGSGVVPDRQTYSHPHETFVIGTKSYVADLGSDKIWRYNLNGGKVVKAGFTETGPGTGPRHMARHVDNLYVMFELKNIIKQFKIIVNDGSLKYVNEFEVLPPPTDPKIVNYGAEITPHPNGKWLYCSNRGQGSLLFYTINPSDGSLERNQVRHYNI